MEIRSNSSSSENGDAGRTGADHPGPCLMGSFPYGNNSMARAIREKDWAATSLGPLDAWPDELRFALGMILESKFPYYLVWGEQMLSFYNDAYKPYVDESLDALGMPFRELWDDAWPTIGPIVRAAYQGSASYFEDLPIRMPRPGRWAITWWTFCFSPIRGRDGGIGGVLCTVSETTRHVALGKELERSETALRRFNDLVPQLLWEADAAGIITYMNRRMATFTGTEPSEHVDWTANVHPDDIAAIVAISAEAQAERRSFECQHRMRCHDGSYRWVLARAAPVIDDAGDVGGWYGCATDVHDWRLAVDSLRQSEDLVRRFAENAARILWITDLETGRVEFLNAAGRRFWHGDSDDAISSWDHWFAIVHADHHTMAADAVERVREGETFTGTFRVADADGALHNMRTTLFPILERDGRIAKFGSIADHVDAPTRQLVHLVDPDRDAHRRLAAELWAKGFEVRGFTDVHAFAKAAPSLMPGCVLIRGTHHTAWIGRAVAAARQQPDRLRPIVLTERHRDVDKVLELMKLGAGDVLPHDADWAMLSAAIEQALAGIENSRPAPRESSGGGAEKLSLLSGREREILAQLVNGSTNKMVAIELGISPRTVEAHRARIMEKLEVSTLAEAIAIAVSNQPR